MSTHGTDQYLVQRYLCTDRPRRAAAALLSSGAVVFAQFIGFLFIGVLLFAFYEPHASPIYNDFAAACAQVNPTEAAGRCLSDPVFARTASATFPFAGGDRVFPDFITQAHAVGTVGPGRRGHLRRRALVVAQLDCGDGGQRSLQALPPEARRTSTTCASHTG